MEKNTAQTVVKVYAVLAWIGATLNIIGGIGLLLGGSAIAGYVGQGYEQLIAGSSIFIGVLLIAFGLVEAYVGWGLWNQLIWSRVAVIVISALNLLNFPLGTFIGLIGIYLFGFNDKIRSLFHNSELRSARAVPMSGRQWK